MIRDNGLVNTVPQAAAVALPDSERLAYSVEEAAQLCQHRADDGDHVIIELLDDLRRGLVGVQLSLYHLASLPPTESRWQAACLDTSPTPRYTVAMSHYDVMDIIDTSVKIGLGAGIGALGSIWMARRQRQHEFDKEMMRRRCDTLERISDDFEQRHTLIVDWFAIVRVQSDLRTSGRHSEDIDRDEVKVREKMVESGPQIHKVVGKLMLLNFADCAKAHDEYAVQYGALLQFGKRDHTQQEWVDAWSKLDVARNRFHAELSKAYLQRP